MDGPILELRKHYAVDLGACGKIYPIRKTEVTTRLIGQCKEVITDLLGRRVRCYVAEGAVAKLLAPYMDSKRLK